MSSTNIKPTDAKVLVYDTFINHSNSRGNRYLRVSSDHIQGFGGGWKLSGHGNVTSPSCGTFFSMYTTTDHSESIVKVNNCKVLACPRCATGAASIKAEKIALELVARARQCHRHIHHWSFHPPILNVEPNYWKDGKLVQGRQGPATLSFQHFRKILQEFKGTLIANGLEYGVIIFHSHRLKERIPSDITRQFDELYVSPHFHVLGIGNITDSDDFSRLYNYTYRGHGPRKYAYNVKSTLVYLFSHSTTIPEKHAYYWVEKNKSTKSIHGKHVSEYESPNSGKNFYKVNPGCYVLDGWYPFPKDKSYVDQAYIDSLNPYFDKHFTIEFPNGIELEPEVLTIVSRWCRYGHVTVFSEIFDVPEYIKKFLKDGKYDEYDASMRRFESIWTNYDKNVKDPLKIYRGISRLDWKYGSGSSALRKELDSFSKKLLKEGAGFGAGGRDI